MKRFYFLLCSLMPFTVFAQPTFDVASCNYMQAHANRHNNKTANDFSFFAGEINLPITWNSRNISVINPVYEWHRFKFGEDSASSEEQLHDYALWLSHRIALRDTNHYFLFAAGLRHYGEISLNPGKTTITPAVAALYGRQVNPRFGWQIGGYYSKEFFGHYWLPLVGFEWQASKRLYTWGILPKFAVVDYAITRSLHACFFYKGVTDSYRVQRSDYFAWIEGQARFGFEYYLPDFPLVFTLDAGQSAARTYFAYDHNTDTAHELLPANGLLFHAGIQLRVITNKNFFGPQRK